MTLKDALIALVPVAMKTNRDVKIKPPDIWLVRGKVVLDRWSIWDGFDLHFGETLQKALAVCLAHHSDAKSTVNEVQRLVIDGESFEVNNTVHLRD